MRGIGDENGKRLCVEKTTKALVKRERYAKRRAVGQVGVSRRSSGEIVGWTERGEMRDW